MVVEADTQWEEDRTADVGQEGQNVGMTERDGGELREQQVVPSK
jgi:hypothetical protein